MPDKKTIEKARKDKREGKSPSTQAGEFVHEEIDKIRRGEHGARSTQQAIAIGAFRGETRRRRPAPAQKGQGEGEHAQKRRIRL
ncbi:hypothetical protein [Mesorhizobium sp. M0778]|uniref:hypothetical protein n=1 Tax=Mesorhizobium sp. M0778 TaxID=2956999 RepID=UPI003338A889